VCFVTENFAVGIEKANSTTDIVRTAVMARIQPNVQTIISYVVPAAEENRTCSDRFLVESNGAS